MNRVVNQFLLTDNNFFPEMHMTTFSAFGLYLK